MGFKVMRVGYGQILRIVSVCLVIAVLGYLVQPIIVSYDIQTLLSGSIKRSTSTGRIETAKDRYKTSPFGVDYVIEGDQPTATRFYDTRIPKAQRVAGDAAETMTVFLSRPTRIDVTFTVDDVTTAVRPRMFIYDEISHLVDTGGLDIATTAFAPFQSPYTLTTTLSPGLYRLRQMFQREDVAAIDVAFVPDVKQPDTLLYDAYVVENTKTLYFDIMPGQLARLTELRTAQEINWANLPVGDWAKRYLPGPKESVQSKVRSEHGDWAFAEIKLSGRNAAHKSDGGLPSADVTIKAGELPYGLKKFKLYVVQSKSSGYDMFMERFINDMGVPINRQDLVKIVVNGELFGYMQLHEDFDTSLFEAGQFVEGPVIGYDTDPIIANPGHSWFRPRSYYDDNVFKVAQEVDIGTLAMTERYCPFAMGNSLAAGVFYNGMHGLGADTRFHFDFRRNCVNPIYKDFNSGVYAIAKASYEKTKRFVMHPSVMALRTLSVLTPTWRPYTPTYASYFVTRKENTPDNQSFYFYWTVTPPVMNYSNSAAHDLEFMMAMDRMYSESHADRFNNRQKNYTRAIRVLNELPHTSSPLMSPKVPTLDKIMPISTMFDLFAVPSQCDDSYVRTLIEKASNGVTVPDCRDMHRLAWRNAYVESLLQVYPTDKVGVEVTTKQITTPHATFLYQKDRGDFADIFFVERICGMGCGANMWLIDDETGSRIEPTASYDAGTVAKTNTLMDLLLANIVPDEKVRVIYFAVPKKDRYQHLLPQYAGSGSYYGSHGVAVVPLTVHPDIPKSVTSAASIVPHASVETFFDVNGSVLTWKKNQPIPNQIIYIPKGYTWKVDAPLTIELAKQGCFEIWGDVDIAPAAKLELTDSGNGWSGIHFYHNRDLNLRNLYVSKGGYNEEFVFCGSRKFTTVVGFYETSVHINNLHISQNMSEDALHLVHTDMILEDSSITGTASDAVDSDFSSVVFHNFTIEGAGTLGENGGDSLDFSGSLAQLHGMHLRNSSDKGISVGENSVVNVYDSDILNGNFGIAIKDASELTVQGTTITGSKTGIGIYSKKPYYVRPVFDITQNDVTFVDVRVNFNPQASPD
jgi:hypothetical protein